MLSSLEGSRKIAENTCSVIDFDICFYCADVIDSHVDILSYEPSLSVSLSLSVSQLAVWDSLRGMNGSLKESKVDSGMQGVLLRVATLLVCNLSLY